jgi:glucan 1,3-beta-glucosidase
MVFFIFYLLVVTVCLPLSKRQTWDFENDKIRGVNLGGWFVLEPYITPSLFDGLDDSIVDEYTFTKYQDKSVASQALNNHWDTWYTWQDFCDIKDSGINVVRIPIGYWAWKLLDTDPYIQGQIQYLDRALGWAQQLSLKVILDLHGVPGSQNGFDNSGLRDHLEFPNGNNPDDTLWVLQQIFWKYGNGEYSDYVIGIQLINEPLGPAMNMDFLKTIYKAGYVNLRSTGSVTPVIFHDAFQTGNYWNDFLSPQQSGDYFNIVIDHHHYQVFSPDQVKRDYSQHLNQVCDWGWDSTKELHWNFCGEWSAALTDCARWLNGRGRGSRWEGQYDNSNYNGDCSAYANIDTWPQEYKENVRKYIEAQLDAFELKSGWIFWNWKTENAPEWDMKALLANQLFPSPFDQRWYPNQCRFN